MNRVRLTSTSRGLELNPKLMELGGIKPGKPVSIEFYKSYIKIFQEELVKEDIEDIAVNYAFENFGDNVGIKTPKKEKNRWIVPLILDYSGREIGKIEINEGGEVLKAPVKADLLKKVKK